MASCETCVANIGVITVIITSPLVKVMQRQCPECQGVGYTCNRCGNGFDSCRCPDEPPPSKKESWE